MPPARIDLDVVASPERVDGAVATRYRPERGLGLASFSSYRQYSPLLVRRRRRPRAEAARRRKPTSGSARLAHEQLQKRREPRWRSRREWTTSSVVSRTARSCAATLPPRSHSIRRTRVSFAARRIHDLIRAVGGGVRGDDDLDALGRVVEREQVRQPPLDHRLRVVGCDDDSHVRFCAGVLLVPAAVDAEPGLRPPRGRRYASTRAPQPSRRREP